MTTAPDGYAAGLPLIMLHRLACLLLILPAAAPAAEEAREWAGLRLRGQHEDTHGVHYREAPSRFLKSAAVSCLDEASRRASQQA